MPSFYHAAFNQDGFAVINEIYTAHETAAIATAISEASQASPVFRKSTDLFAIRQCCKTLPGILPMVFTPGLCNLLQPFTDMGYAMVKSIYFDKPPQSNWFVAWHQDLTISVDSKAAIAGYGPYTAKHNQFAVQPPEALLQRILTIRIHLDNTDEQNGALQVLPGSHANGICRTAEDYMRAVSCPVRRGGVMLMRPLLWHSSSRTTNGERRRVLHLEFSCDTLPEGLQWAERIAIPATRVTA